MTKATGEREGLHSYTVHCATCEKDVSGPCNSLDCSTPDSKLRISRANLVAHLRTDAAALNYLNEDSENYTQAADMLAADAQEIESLRVLLNYEYTKRKAQQVAVPQAVIDGMTDGEDKMFEQIVEWQRLSYNNSRRQIRGQQLSRSDSPDWHLVWAALRWAKEHPAQPVEVPQEPVAEINHYSDTGCVTWLETPFKFRQGTKLYLAAPQPPQAALVPAADLTDNEVLEIGKTVLNRVDAYDDGLEFARAVLAAQKAKGPCGLSSQRPENAK